MPCMGVRPVLFSEVYGSYYNVIAAILAEAVSGGLTDRRIDGIIREKAFGESVLTIPAALREGRWPLLTAENTTPLERVPTMPLTVLQKRWLKALLRDPRIRLFSPSEEGLEAVEPLYAPDTFYCYDRCSGGDPYGDDEYVGHFRTVLTALRENRKLRVAFAGSGGERHLRELAVCKLEYFSEEDSFSLIASSPQGGEKINVARIISCELLDGCGGEARRPPEPEKKTLVLELTDERNALERVMLHFSHLEKEARRLEGGRWRLELRCDGEDESEMIIRVLSFGKALRAVSPRDFVEKIRERLENQRRLGV